MSELTGKKVKPVPKEPKEIGIDTDDSLVTGILDAVQAGSLNNSVIESFTTATRTREQIYGLIDVMGEDDRVSSVLETYAEDATATNDKGQIVWCESSDDEVNKYVSYLLDSLNIDKHVYDWTYSLCKYGDIYIRLYRQSEYNNDPIFGKKDESKTLNEDIYVKVNKDNDNYVHFVEMMPNSAEYFELTKFGKTMGFINAPTNIQTSIKTETDGFNYFNYEFKKDDITVYNATDFVHGCLTSTNYGRFPEEVNIIREDDNDETKVSTTTYTVKKGQSLLYNDFKIWRELSLLENSVLLNRVVKSALVRIVNVKVNNMPKEQVRNYIARLKSKIEQKTALNTGNNINEYNNVGPVDNTIFVPVGQDGQGELTMTNIGGDFDPKQLTDLDYFLNKFYGGLRVPKQFFSNTDDSAGFNGGSSLAIISSRYGKMIKRIQNTICQTVTDIINLFLLDKGLSNYVNKFTIRMQGPVTQEELDRREDMRNRMGVINDILSQTNNVVKDDVLKLKIVKSLLSTSISDPEVITLLQEQIEKLEQEGEPTPEEEKDKKDEINLDIEAPRPPRPSAITPEEPTIDLSDEEESEETIETGEEESSYLPSPNELGVELTNNTEI